LFRPALVTENSKTHLNHNLSKIKKHLVNRVNSRDVTGNTTVKNCGKANPEWNCNTKESSSFLHKSKQHPSP
jgi:hypothetical protein